MRMFLSVLGVAALLPLGVQAAKVTITASDVEKFQQERGQWYLRIISGEGKTLASYDLTNIQKGKPDLIPVSGKQPLQSPQFQLVRKSPDKKSEGFSGCAGDLAGSHRVFVVDLSKAGPGTGVTCKVKPEKS